MKTIYLILIALLATTVACNSITSVPLEKTSSSGKVKVTIESERLTSVDPWKVAIKIKAYDFEEGQLATEVMSREISDKTVKFDWVDESSAYIVFTQTDGTTKVFELIASAQQLQFAQIPALP